MQIHMNSDRKKHFRTGKVKNVDVRRAGATFVAISLLLLFLTACDSGGGSGSGGAALNEGLFVDSPVSGLNYQTETQAGITDENGLFHYRDGENVRFSIGDVVLGEAPAQALMTPLHLVDEPVDEVSVTHPVVTNIARFLQSLDADANPENGIKIREDIIQEVSGRMIDFHQTVHEFETDTHVMMLFDTLNGLNMPHNGENWHLRATDQVRQHMTEHMDDWMNGRMDSGPNDDLTDDGDNNGNDAMPDSGDTMNPGDGMHNGGNSSSGPADTHEGVFIDSPVAGLNYQTQTQAGITDAEGTFHYMEGETVRFSIGDVFLGEASGETIMTPMHLAGESLEDIDGDNPALINMIRFMQSLDADGNPENGITISEDVRNEISGRMIDFHQSVYDFESDPHVMAMFDAMNGLNMPHAGQGWHLHDSDAAMAHMIDYMNEHMGNWADVHMGDWMYEWMDDHMGPGGGFNQDESSGSDGMYQHDDDSGMQDSGGIMNSGDNSNGDDWDDMHGGAGGGHGMGH